MAYIDIDLDRIDADDLIDALSNQYLNESDQLQLLELIKTSDSPKLQLFLKVMDKYSVIELEELFKEHTEFTEVPKEQLKIVFEY